MDGSFPIVVVFRGMPPSGAVHSLIERHAHRMQERVPGLEMLRLQAVVERRGATFLQAIALNAEDPEAHNNLAGIYVRQEKWAEAVPGYRRAAELKPDDPKYQIQLGGARLTYLRPPQEPVPPPPHADPPSIPAPPDPGSALSTPPLTFKMRLLMSGGALVCIAAAWLEAGATGR